MKTWTQDGNITDPEIIQEGPWLTLIVVVCYITYMHFRSPIETDIADLISWKFIAPTSWEDRADEVATVLR